MPEELFHEDERVSDVVQQISGQLRLSLGNIHSALVRLAPPELRDEDEGIDRNAALLCQSYYRILRLANNLSDAAEPERPEGAGAANEDIIELCRTVMDEAQVPAEMLGIELEFRCPKDSHIIFINRERISRLLMNLLSNAFKFIGNGEKRVSLEVRIDGGYVFLVLSDTGKGIAPELLDSVFDRCRQPGRMDPPPHGLGLGLPLCRRIAREHGGSLALASEAGKGTTVTVSLPNKRGPQRLGTVLPVDLLGGFNRTLVELADVLPKQAFTQKYLD